MGKYVVVVAHKTGVAALPLVGVYFHMDKLPSKPKCPFHDLLSRDGSFYEVRSLSREDFPCEPSELPSFTGLKRFSTDTLSYSASALIFLIADACFSIMISSFALSAHQTMSIDLENIVR